MDILNPLFLEYIVVFFVILEVDYGEIEGELIGDGIVRYQVENV